MDVEKELGTGVAIAQETRGKERLNGLMPDLFRGKLRLDLLFEWKNKTPAKNPELEKMLNLLKEFITKNYALAEEIEKTKEIPDWAIQWFCDNGYFGLKLPKEYGGMDFMQSEYMQVLQLVATWSGAIVALLSASNTIGVGWPIVASGSPEQKARWLPIIARSPSGFAFTEEKAGSDPGKMESYGRRHKDAFGNTLGYHLNGRKLWTTNGPKNDSKYISPVIIVIAKIVDDPEELKNPKCKNFGAFIVPSDWPGIKIVQRCDFAGLYGIYNGVTDFENVYLPKKYLLGKKQLENGEVLYEQEGDGFRIALQALNSGRITLAGACVAMAKNCVEVGAWWGNTRFQWNKFIGKHEAVGSGILAKDLAETFALEAMVWFASMQADQHRECRMEAATCKVLASEKLFDIADNLLQIRGGRGYETAASLAKRGEPPVPVERWWRDARINRIFEGESGALLRMFTVGEGLNDYVARGLIFDEKGQYWEQFKTIVGFGKDLVMLNIPSRLNGSSSQIPKVLQRHLSFVEQSTRKLARVIILTCKKYGKKLMYKQLTLMRFFQIAAELYAMATTCAYSAYRGNESQLGIADLYCQMARDRMAKEFEALNNNCDSDSRVVAAELLNGSYNSWLKTGITSAVDEMDLENKTRGG